MQKATDKKSAVDDIGKEIEASKGTRIWTDYVNALKLISQVVFTRSSGFVLELIQNAEDAGLGLPDPGVFEIKINKHRVKITHNGRPFGEDDVKALCGIRSSKKPEKGTLGYLGIGFKSVFKVTDCPEVYSDGFQLKFDRNAYKDPGETPWHVIPIWLEEPSEGIDGERTTFILPLRETEGYLLLLQELKKIRTELYLFLRWLKRIEVTDEARRMTWTLENKGEDEEGITTLEHDSQQQRFRFFRRVIEVHPRVKQDRMTQEYRLNVRKREICIAFPLDKEGNLAPSSAGAMYGGVYSFLPLGEASSGAPFPIQADFLVQPGRESINYEAKWNHWLVEEIASLCKEAIDYFKNHEKWKYQFLPCFEFTGSEGQESYDKLFGPSLCKPLKKFVEGDDCVATIDGGWAKLRQVVRLDEDEEALEDLVNMAILKRAGLASAMGGQAGLKLVHPNVIDPKSRPIRKANRFGLLKNRKFLERKCRTSNAAKWFGSLYLWLYKHPYYEEYFIPRKQLERYHDFQFILTSGGGLFSGGEVFVLDIPSTDPIIKDLANELNKPLVHPGIFSGASDEEKGQLIGFLQGFTGLQILDSKKVAKEALLPKILTSTDKPSPEDLLKYTICCQQILGGEVGDGLEFWVLTKEGDVRAAREVFFPAEFRPEQDWEANCQYLPGLQFISERYLPKLANEDQLKRWRQFFGAGGVKKAPANGVEEFAMNYAVEKLKLRYKNVTRVDKMNFGYDLEARTKTGRKICIEVKGQTGEEDVELTGNETDAADKYKDAFYLCVVSSIPENPTIHMVQDPAGVGKKEKLTVPVDTWKRWKWPQTL